MNIYAFVSVVDRLISFQFGIQTTRATNMTKGVDDGWCKQPHLSVRLILTLGLGGAAHLCIEKSVTQNPTW